MSALSKALPDPAGGAESEARHYLCYFDINYLTRGLALYASLRRHGGNFVLWILCLDQESEAVLRRLALGRIHVLTLSELELADPALLAVKPGRLPLEYYWTCGPSALCHILKLSPQIRSLTYLDADMYFFSDPEALFTILGNNSILVTDQGVVDSRGTGQFNVGIVIFRNTPNTVRCIRRWREQCLEWCFDRFEDGKHGDQGYLNNWPDLYDVTIVGPALAGLAPWNINQKKLWLDSGWVTCDEGPLVCYHFARLRRVAKWVYELHDYRFHRTKLNPIARRHLYAPYVRALWESESMVLAANGRISSASAHNPSTPAGKIRRQRSSSVPWTSLARYQRFMWIIGPWVF